MNLVVSLSLGDGKSKLLSNQQETKDLISQVGSSETNTQSSSILLPSHISSYDKHFID